MKHLRRSPRTKIKVQKTIPVRMITEAGEILHRYVRLINLSEGGLKMSGDLPHPEGPFHLEFQSRAVCREKFDEMPEVRFQVDNRWKKELYGDMWVGGFAFLAISPEQQQVVRELIQQHNEEENSQQALGDNPVNLGVVAGRGTRWYYPLINRLDLECIEFQSTEELKLDGTCQLNLAFRETNRTVQVNARLVWRRELDNTHRYCLAFQNLTPEAMTAIQACRLYSHHSEPLPPAA